MFVRYKEDLQGGVCMRAALIAGSYPPDPCGVGDYTARLAEALGRNGLGVDVVVPARPDRVQRADYLRPIISSFGVVGLAQLAAGIARLAPEVVHIQYPTLGFGRRLGPRLLPTLLRLRARRSRVVVTLHDPARNRLALVYNTLPILAAHGVVFVEDRNVLTQWGRLRAVIARGREVRVIPIASNMPVAHLTRADRESTRGALRIPEGALMLCYFGQVKPQKGVQLLPEIMDRLPEAYLVIVGAGGDGRLSGQLNATLSRPPLQERVRILGYQPPDRVALYLAAADAAVFPLLEGHSERSGSVLAAVTQGTFTVTTHPTLRGLQGNIYYASPGDVADMAEAVRRYAGRKETPVDVERQWDNIAAQHIQLYRELVEGL